MRIEEQMQKKLPCFFDSDLAEERHKTCFQNGGICFEKQEKGGVTVTHLTVSSKEGTKAIGRDEGRYITVSFPSLNAIASNKILGELKNALRTLVPPNVDRILVVGLGNRRLTADSLGVRRRI